MWIWEKRKSFTKWENDEYNLLKIMIEQSWDEMRVNYIFISIWFWFILKKKRMRVIKLSELNLIWYLTRKKRYWIFDQVFHINSSYHKKMINVTQNAVLILLSYSMKWNCERILRKIMMMNERWIFLASLLYIHFSSLMIKSMWESLKMSEKISLSL